MPSPVGHSLIGLALGVAAYLPRGPWSAWRARVRGAAGPLLAGVILANAPDLDYLPGVLRGDLNAYHHGYTHSLGWILLAGGGAWLVWKGRRPRIGWREAVFVFAALASHLVADWLTDDGRPPYGIMAWWPWAPDYTISPVTPFWRLLKKNYADLLQWHNVGAVLVEIAWCLPLVLLACIVRRCRGAGALCTCGPTH